MPKAPLILIGYGDIAARVACRHPEHTITALARRQSAAPAAHRGQWHSMSYDLDAPNAALDFPADALWLYFAPPQNTGTQDTRVANWLAAQSQKAPPRAVVYASTTGVYGDQGGAWVNEATAPAPQHDRARRRLSAERQFSHWCEGQHIPLTILRLAGIYAADRLPIARIIAAEPIVCLDESPWSNRIHADDCADIITALIDRIAHNTPVTGIYNISDNTPRPMSELYLATAAHFGLPSPPCLPLAQVLTHASPMAREFLTESKRIDARAIQAALNWQPRYPNLAATLVTIKADLPRANAPRE